MREGSPPGDTLPVLVAVARVPTHTPSPKAHKVWDGNATNPSGRDAPGVPKPWGPRGRGLQPGVSHPWGLPSPFWGWQPRGAKAKGGGPPAEGTRVPSPCCTPAPTSEFL